MLISLLTLTSAIGILQLVCCAYLPSSVVHLHCLRHHRSFLREPLAETTILILDHDVLIFSRNSTNCCCNYFNECLYGISAINVRDIVSTAKRPCYKECNQNEFLRRCRTLFLQYEERSIRQAYFD